MLEQITSCPSACSEGSASGSMSRRPIIRGRIRYLVSLLRHVLLLRLGSCTLPLTVRLRLDIVGNLLLSVFRELHAVMNSCTSFWRSSAWLGILITNHICVDRGDRSWCNVSPVSR